MKLIIFIAKIICIQNFKNRVSFYRIIEFGLNVEDYFKSWEHAKAFDKTKNISFDVNNLSFEYNSEFIVNYNQLLGFMNISLKDYNFDIYHSNSNICGSYSLIKHITGKLFKHNDKYYVCDYKKLKYVINNKCVINDEIIKRNPFIKSASKNLNDILPFVNGDEIYEKSYNGYIVDDIYIKNEIKNITNNLSIYSLSAIIYDINKLDK